MTRLCFSIALLFVVAPAYSRDDLLQLMNALRVSECPQHLRSDQPFNGNSKLNQAARYVNDGRSMQEALRRADYRADQSAVIHATRGDNPAAFKRLLAKGYCATLTDPRLVEIGIATNRDEVALIFAAPFAPPAPGDATKVEREALRLVNEARAKARSCGGKRFAAVGPLTLNDTLHVAAVTHAKDMAAHGQVEHEGSDGSSPDERATRAGYRWQSVGENIAGGQLTAQEVVAGWIASPHHCANIMDPDYTQMAVAYVINTKQKIGIFWAQEFGRPR